MAIVAENFRFLPTFEDKIEAIVLLHQIRASTSPTRKRKSKQISAIPIGLSSSADEQNIGIIIKTVDNYPLNG